MKEQSGGERTNGVPVPQLAFLRKQAGLSQQALAERARVSRQTINRLERGALDGRSRVAGADVARGG